LPLTRATRWGQQKKDNPMVMRKLAFLGILSIVIVAASGVASAEEGIGTIYALRGEGTASGEYARPDGLTAAHKTLPFGTMVKVTNKRNGRTVVVKITDRGPFGRGRIIDLTPAGANALGFYSAGITPVSLEVVGKEAIVFNQRRH
jgi:rare lipoprotein A